MKKSALLLLISIVFLTSVLFLNSQLATRNLGPVFAQLGPQQQNVSVTAIVPPKVGDFQFTFKSNVASSEHQDKTLTYDIIYGASSSAGLSTTNTIVVNYSANLAPDGSYVVDYVVGSAGKAYGETQPVVNTRNRTITWSLPPLPQGTIDQKVSFQLRTNSSYRELKRITFTSRATMSNEYLTLPTQGIKQDYLYDPTRVEPEPTATPAPLSTPIPTVTPAPTLRITDIAFTTISDKNATIAVTSTKPVRASIQYGISPTELTKTVQNTQFGTYNELSLTDLKPQTDYYFKVTITNPQGRFLRSETFTFRTAQSPRVSFSDRDAFVITSGSTVLLSAILGEQPSTFVIIPTNTKYQLVYTFSQPPGLDSIEVIVRNNAGIMQRVQMTSKDDLTYIGQLATSSTGSYNIELSQTNAKGNVVSRKISNLKVVSPIRVLELETNAPIIDARVFLSSFNKQTGQYEAIDDSNYKNPSFTESNGEIQYILLPGKYRVAVSAFGYKEQAKDFTLGKSTGEEFPTIRLERDLFNIAAIANYITSLFIDSANYILASVMSLSASVRVFNNAAMLGVTSTVGLGFMLFGLRTDILWKDLLPFFVFNLAVLGRNHKEAYLYGKASDGKNQPLGRVRIEVLDIKTQTVLGHTTSNKSGSFHFLNTFNRPYVKLVLTKENLTKMEMIVATDKKGEMQIRLQNRNDSKPMVAGLKHIGGELFELVLLLSFIAELLFLLQFGVAKTLPFFILSVLNLSLWLFYQRNHK